MSRSCGDCSPEEWRVVPSEPAYEVSNLGRTRSRLRLSTSRSRHGNPFVRKLKGRVLVPVYQPGTGYYDITVDSGRYVNGKRVPRRRSVASMVLEAFVGPRPSPRHLARHLNDLKWDNRLDNLAWGLPKQNAEDKVRNGNAYRPQGELHHHAKLTDDQVRQLRAVYKRYGKEHVALAKEFGINPRTAHGICTGKGWSHVA